MQNVSTKPAGAGRLKFIIGGALIFAAVVYLVWSSTNANAQYFQTIEELQSKSKEMVGKDVRVFGAVLGDTIKVDAQNLTIYFTVVHSPGDTKTVDAMGGMAEVLRKAVLDSSLPRMQVVYKGVKPDLLKNEAQAIMTGKMGEDGLFYASELLLKCPSKYEDAAPQLTPTK